MRLTCPKCRAQYEVDHRAIPEEGRDVQCSNCGQTWFQERVEPGPLAPAHATPPAPATPETDLPAPEPDLPKVEDAAPAKASVESSILNILREEAEREQRARADERAATPQPTAPATTDAPTPAPQQPAPEEPAIDAPSPEPELAAEPQDETATVGAEMLRQNSLPDLDRISSTLVEIEESEKYQELDPEEEEERSGFSSGFALVIVIFGLALVSYTFAPTITGMVPALEPQLDQYVAFVDQIRIQTDQLIMSLISKIEG